MAAEPIDDITSRWERRCQELAAEAPKGGPNEPTGDPHWLKARHLERQWRDAIPARFRDATVEDLDGPVADLADGWDRQSNVLLLGAVGVGKTHAAIAIARQGAEEGQQVAFHPAVELLDELRPGGGDPNTLDKTCGVDVLVLDDLGLERPTDWTAERLYLLVNRRWLERRPTIVTSNLAPEALQESVGQQLWSRLYHDAETLKMAGDDRRMSP